MIELLCVLVTLILSGEALTSEYIHLPLTRTTGGLLVGTYLTTREGRRIMAYMSIPFGKPPVGSRRFEPPDPADPWEGILPAIKQPYPCLQCMDPESVEDCLYLNVFTPSINPSRLLPVLFFIPGGAGIEGGANSFTPEYLLDKDMVLVVVQYRMEFFGFLSTGDEIVPGNMFLKDIRLALRWVQANIINFGGDPKKVTISGESSGGAHVHSLLMFLADEGLFQAGISQSGSAFSPWTFISANEMKNMVLHVSKLSSCPSDSKGLVECLKMKPAEDIHALYLDYKKTLNADNKEQFINMPLFGAVLEPECVGDRIITGHFWHQNVTVPWLVGVTSKEMLFAYFLALADPTNFLFHRMDRTFDRNPTIISEYRNSVADGTGVISACKEFYLNNQHISRRTLSAVVDLFSDESINYGVYEGLLRATKNSSYLYYYDYIGANEYVPIINDGQIGASHANDMWLFWPHPYRKPNTRLLDTEEDTVLSKKLIDLWYNFMIYHDPTPEEYEGLKWIPFYPNDSYLIITREGEFEMDSHFLQERMEFWKRTPYPFRDDVLEPIPCKYTNKKTFGLGSADDDTNNRT